MSSWHNDFDFDNAEPEPEDEGVSLGQVAVVRETQAAVLYRGRGLGKPDPFGTEGAGDPESWVPISQIYKGPRGVGKMGELVISTWLSYRRAEENK